jgi:hypothetical protein
MRAPTRAGPRSTACTRPSEAMATKGPKAKASTGAALSGTGRKAAPK